MLEEIREKLAQSGEKLKGIEVLPDYGHTIRLIVENQQGEEYILPFHCGGLRS